VKQGRTIHQQQLDGTEAFLLVAERRSFRAAANELGLSPSAISQKIKTLEARMGVPLLTRTTRSVGLTQAGQILYDRARPALDQLTSAFEEAGNLSQPVGLLRLHMPRGVLAFAIEPIIADFCAAYPRINVEITAADTVVDVVEQGYDAAIHLGELLDNDMIALRLTPPVRFAIAGSPAYFAQHGRPECPEDIAQHMCLAFALPDRSHNHWIFMVEGRPLQLRIEPRLSVNDNGLLLSATRRGVGLCYVSDRQIENDLRMGTLETVMDPWMPTSEGLFLYYPSRAQALPKLRVFIDFLRAHIGR
jgi:DNA-binding transcriptional LysR family regulator